MTNRRPLDHCWPTAHMEVDFALTCDFHLITHVFWKGHYPPKQGVLAGFCVSSWHKLELSHTKRRYSLKESMKYNSKAFSELVISCVWCQPWGGSTGFYKNASWASQGKQSSKRHPLWPLHQLLLPDLCELQSWLPLVMNSNVEV